jgi:REP element-mobilizing transposase RayT
MTLYPVNGHAALRRGRLSRAGAAYFLTFGTEARRTGLVASPVAGTIFKEAGAMAIDGTWIVHSAVVLPDHVHLLIALGQRLPLAKAMQRLKAKTSPALRATGLSWERGYFDRQLRPDDDWLSVLLYIYLNPYRAGLVGKHDQWPHYFCREAEWVWFRDLLDSDRPNPEWLA